MARFAFTLGVVASLASSSLAAGASERLSVGAGPGYGWGASDGLCGSVYADAYWLRQSNRDLGLGTMLGATLGKGGAFAFGGPSILVPAAEGFPMLFWGGAFAGADDVGSYGFAGGVWFGSKSYNYSGRYEMGYLAGVDFRVGEAGDLAFGSSVRIDLAVLYVPALLVIEGIRGQ